MSILRLPPPPMESGFCSINPNIHVLLNQRFGVKLVRMFPDQSAHPGTCSQRHKDSKFHVLKASFCEFELEAADELPLQLFRALILLFLDQTPV